jgi:hypothetical protein
MTIIKINNYDDNGGPTEDSIKYNKDCPDFKILDDGTILGDCKYCNLSLQCRQVSVNMRGEVLPMEAHRLPLYDEFGEKISEELFCTGMFDFRPLKERIEDDKVS